MAVTTLIPPPVQAAFQPHKSLAFAFGPRFFVALLIGLLWLIPAWWASRLIAAMFVWDGLLLVAWLVDLRRIPAPSQLQGSRIWTHAPSLGHSVPVTIELSNGGGVDIHASLIDEIPASLRDQPPSLDLDVPAGEAAQIEYTIVPKGRGDITLRRLFVRYRTSLGLAERWAAAPIDQTVRVLPDLEQAKHQALYLIRSRQVEMEKRRQRQRGTGRDFEALREYRQGDDMRDICWSATARRNQLTTRTYQVERSQAVWIVLDAGRLLRAQVSDAGRQFRSAKLDYAVDAALSLAQVASQSGDRVGLIAYGRGIQQSIGLGRGPAHLRTFVDSLAQVHNETPEANHSLAARVLLRKQSRRSLIVWITDFAETPTTPEVIEYATQMARRHLVVFAAVSQLDLIALAKKTPQTEDEMFRHAAAQEIVQRRDRLLRGLRERGVLAIDLVPGLLATGLVNQYLEVKDRSLL